MKRGYFFSVDAVLAIIILGGGIIFLFTQLTAVPDMETPKHISTDLMGLLFDVRIGDICKGPMVPIADCECLYETLQTNYYCQGKISDVDFTLLEYFGMLYAQDPSNVYYINQMINETITESNLVPKNYNFTFILTDHSDPSSDPITLYPI